MSTKVGGSHINYNSIVPGHIDACFLLPFGAVQREGFMYRIEVHLNSVESAQTGYSTPFILI
mgnify:CR=1 FL=1